MNINKNMIWKNIWMDPNLVNLLYSNMRQSILREE